VLTGEPIGDGFDFVGEICGFDILGTVRMVNAVCDGCRRLPPLASCILHQDLDSGILFVNRVLDVVAGIPTKRGHGTDPLREHWRLLFLVVVELTAFFEFAS